MMKRYEKVFKVSEEVNLEMFQKGIENKIKELSNKYDEDNVANELAISLAWYLKVAVSRNKSKINSSIFFKRFFDELIK